MTELTPDNISPDVEAPLSPEFLRLLDAAFEMEKRLGLPGGFVLKLSDEDDWGFVLKSLSVIDAALEHTILTQCFSERKGRNHEKLKKMMGGLNIEGRNSKLAYVEAFNLLSSRSLSFVKALNLVRNIYAHKPTYTKKTVREIGKERPDQKIIKHLMIFGEGVSDGSEAHERFFILMSALSILWELEFATQPRSPIQSVVEALRNTTNGPLVYDGSPYGD